MKTLALISGILKALLAFLAGCPVDRLPEIVDRQVELGDRFDEEMDRRREREALGYVNALWSGRR